MSARGKSCSAELLTSSRGAGAREPNGSFRAKMGEIRSKSRDSAPFGRQRKSMLAYQESALLDFFNDNRRLARKWERAAARWVQALHLLAAFTGARWAGP